MDDDPLMQVKDIRARLQEKFPDVEPPTPKTVQLWIRKGVLVGRGLDADSAQWLTMEEIETRGVRPAQLRAYRSSVDAWVPRDSGPGRPVGARTRKRSTDGSEG